LLYFVTVTLIIIETRLFSVWSQVKKVFKFQIFILFIYICIQILGLEPSLEPYYPYLPYFFLGLILLSFVSVYFLGGIGKDNICNKKILEKVFSILFNFFLLSILHNFSLLLHLHLSISPYWLLVFSNYLFNCIDYLDLPTSNLLELENKTNRINETIEFGGARSYLYNNQLYYFNLLGQPAFHFFLLGASAPASGQAPLALASGEEWINIIQKLNTAIQNEQLNSGGKGPQNPFEFWKWIKASLYVSKETIELVEPKVQKGSSVDEIYKEIRSFLDYPSFAENIHIQLGEEGYMIYLSECSAKYMSLDLDSSPNIQYQGKTFYFFHSISELINWAQPSSAESNIKDQINTLNKNSIPFDPIKNADKWEFFKKHQFKWFIELNVPFFINDFVFFNKPLNEVSPSMVMFSKHLSAYEYNRELEFLMDAFKGLNLITTDLEKGELNLNPTDTITYDLKIKFIKFWISQINCYNRPETIQEFNSFLNINMYELSQVKLELLENIVFVQCKILESYWTINYINKLLSVHNNLDFLNNDDKVIDFYNQLFLNFKQEIFQKYQEAYIIRREFVINRYINMSEQELYEGYQLLKFYNHHYEFDSILDRNHFYQKVFPYKELQKGEWKNIEW